MSVAKKIIYAFAALALVTVAITVFNRMRYELKMAEIFRPDSRVCLVEITGMNEILNGSCGDFGYWVKFDVILGNTMPPESFFLVTRFEALWPQGVERRMPTLLRHDSIAVGERHWLVFRERSRNDEYPAGIVGWWPADSPDLPRQIKTLMN